MSNTPSLQVLLLAAGGSSRFGAPKQLAGFDGRPLLQHALAAATQVGGTVTVVLGAAAAQIAPAVTAAGATVLVHRGWSEGIGSSIRAGVVSLPGSCDGVLIMLADQPLIRTHGLRRLMDAWRHQPRGVVASRYAGISGVPAIFPRWCFAELLQLRGDAGARAVLRRLADHVLAVDHPEAAVDIDRPEDLAALRASHEPHAATVAAAADHHQQNQSREQGMPETVGFVGLGIMGSGMVRNLAAKGQRVRVWNRTAARAQALAQALAPTRAIDCAATLPQLCAAVSVLMLCVTNTGDVEQVLLGDDGALAHLQPGSLVIDCSTMSPMHTRAIAQRLRARGIGFVDAPVSGGSEGAAQGTLTVMAGGEPGDFQRAEPLLAAIGTRVTHMGPAGSGQVTKLLNQILVVVNMLAVSEALLFGRAAGLDLRRALSAVEQGAAGSWMLSKRAPQVLDEYWQPGFTIDLQQKDLDLVLEYARQLGLPLLATGMISQLYARLQREGKGGLGNHALIQALEPLAPAVP